MVSMWNEDQFKMFLKCVTLTMTNWVKSMAEKGEAAHAPMTL